MLQKLKQKAAEAFPFIGAYKRFAKAAIDSISSKGTYSQYQEDKFIDKFLQDYKLDDGLYIDIGANHPTDISNTYLLYKRGLKGLIIEPNTELIDLFSTFRKRDICLPVGCGNEVSIAKFNISKTPVLSSFENVEKVWKTKYVPILPLDTIVHSLGIEYIYFLSIDVEGLNYKVLQGALVALQKTLLLCVEFDADDEMLMMEALLQPYAFKKLHIVNCNVFFLNENIASRVKKN